MPTLADKQIFRLRPVIKNFATKRSAYVRDRDGRNILCLVDDSNRIFLHATADYAVTTTTTAATVGGDGGAADAKRGGGGGRYLVKTISWFQTNRKRVQDVCFDPSGTMLLVLCYDNTLHTIPVTWILDREPSYEHFHLAAEKITSFIVPFAGPHECPNSKTCPNNLITGAGDPEPHAPIAVTFESTFADNDLSTTDDRDLTSNGMYNSFFAIGDGGSNNNPNGNGLDADYVDGINGNPEETADPCPYPTSVVWWKTLDGKHCAIVGYSDGTICIVGLEPHCPLVAHTNIERGAVVQMFICRDTILNNVTLMINSTSKEQWKLLLEQKSIGYVFPGGETTSVASDQYYSASSSRQSSEELANYKNAADTVAANKSAADAVAADWKIVIPLNRDPNAEASPKQRPLCLSANAPNDLGEVENNGGGEPAPTSPEFVSGILPSARSRLASLKELGVKKIGALKMKLAENRIKIQDKERYKEHANAFAVMDVPVMNPQILTTPAGPFFIVQYVRNKYLLSAIHSYSDTLSVHSMDISLIPLCIYKIPKNCKNMLITPNLMFTIFEAVDEAPVDTLDAPATDDATHKRPGFNVGIVASNTSELRIGEDSEFQNTSMLSLFQFADEQLIGLYRVADDATSGGYDTDRSAQANDANEAHLNNSYMKEMRYMKTRKKSDPNADEDSRRFLRTEFPHVALDKCMLVTDRNVYLVELRDTPERVFGSIALGSEWDVCEEFCKVFNINFAMSIEFAGDEVLRARKTRHALACYNVARIPSVKTALKLAMFGENNALMHLCAMALKTVYILKSTLPLSYHIYYLDDFKDPRYGGRPRFGDTKQLTAAQQSAIANGGLRTTDFTYETDEAVTDLQMSNSSQFHLSNLLLLTLTEKTIRDRDTMPLWNFLATNKKYHPNMTSIVLCQSGLYRSATLLACTRGAHLDAYCGLVGVCSQEFGWYSELNDILDNLAETMFMECIIYMYTVSLDYFAVIKNKVDSLSRRVLEKLRIQLDPFSPVFRPVVSQLELCSSDVDPEYNSFCKSLIETFLIVIIKLYSLQHPGVDHFANALSSFAGHHDENQFAINVGRNATLSAGFSHCACIVDGVAYAWGSNGVNCLLSSTIQSDTGDAFSAPRPLQFLSNVKLVVHAVRCGRTHTLILTNNGLYATGSNQLGQLGIGMYAAMALQPMLIEHFDCTDIELIEAGQYHNAVVARGILYTWGWGVYGQLGHGDVEVVYTPKQVAFFSDVYIHQIALGHAHTVVLGSDADGCEHIYVFGSNHYGQLGLGQTHGTDEPVMLKSLVPVVLSIAKPIRLIHTKFFTNFIVTEDNELYVWGSSPQALRLQYQAKKRANATRKHEEEAARQAAAAAAAVPPVIPTDGETFHTQSVDSFEMVVRVSASEPDSIAEEPVKCASTPTEDSRPPRSKSLNDLKEAFKAKRLHNGNVEYSDEKQDGEKPVKSPRANSMDEDMYEHMYPTLVDTTDVQGNIVKVSSGLYHNALVSEHRKLYTWGKNLEKQLGRDRSQMDIHRPHHLDTIEDAVHVECGADFTLVMCADLTVKAFGNSSFGQCGRDIAPDKNGIVGKLVRLRISKRVVRIPDSTQCIEYPVNINLPRPQINLNNEPVRFIKSVPAFNRRFIVKSELFDDTATTPTSASSAHPIDSLLQHPNEFIHYCLFIFYGIYNAQHLHDWVDQTEFKVRILMLNYNIKQAFTLCIARTADAADAIKTFEYFTKDVSVVPIHREDLKFLIYALFMHFIERRLDVQLVERFFAADLDHYMFALAYVLFFNNNNTDIERQVLVKFADLFGDEINHNDGVGGSVEALEKSEQIFNATTTTFKTTLCQKLFDYEDNFA